MGRDDEVIGSGETTLLEVQTLETDIVDPKSCRPFLSHGYRDNRTVQPYERTIRELAREEGCEQSDTAAKVQDGAGSADSFGHKRTDGQIVVVPLAIQDRQDVGFCGEVIEGHVLVDAGGGLLPLD